VFSGEKLRIVAGRKVPGEEGGEVYWKI